MCTQERNIMTKTNIIYAMNLQYYVFITNIMRFHQPEHTTTHNNNMRNPGLIAPTSL